MNLTLKRADIKTREKIRIITRGLRGNRHSIGYFEIQIEKIENYLKQVCSSNERISLSNIRWNIQNIIDTLKRIEETYSALLAQEYQNIMSMMSG